jgi:hypothetical protein
MVGRGGKRRGSFVLSFSMPVLYDEPVPVPDFLNIPERNNGFAPTAFSFGAVPRSANGQVQSRSVNAQPLPVRTIRDTHWTAYTIVLPTCAGLSIYSTQKLNSIYHGRHFFGRNALAWIIGQLMRFIAKAAASIPLATTMPAWSSDSRFGSRTSIGSMEHFVVVVVFCHIPS